MKNLYHPVYRIHIISNIKIIIKYSLENERRIQVYMNEED